jgi:hypothetical protein
MDSPNLSTSVFSWPLGHLSILLLGTIHTPVSVGQGLRVFSTVAAAFFIFGARHPKSGAGSAHQWASFCEFSTALAAIVINLTVTAITWH